MVADTAGPCARMLCRVRDNFSRGKFAGTGAAILGTVSSRERMTAAVFSPCLPRRFNRNIKSFELGL